MLTILGMIFVLFVELFFPLILPALIVFLIARKVFKWGEEHYRGEGFSD